jgi:hypothetical protein
MIYGEQEFNDTLIRIIRDEYRHPLYEPAVKLAKEMAVHVYGTKPEELLARVRPGEDDEITQYRLDNYEATTKAPCGKAIKIVSKIFNPNLMSVVFPPENENAERLKQYTLFYYPNYNSLIIYNKDVVLKKMIADPNGLLAVKPQRIPRNDAERVKPIVVTYGSEAIWNWDFDHFLINTKIDKNKDGIFFTFDYYDSSQYIKFIASSPREDELTLEEVEVYPTNFLDKDNQPEIPAWRLRGNSIALDTGEILYESFFADAKPHWNLSVIHENDVMASFVKHMHPQRYIIGEECTNEQMLEGVLMRCNRGVFRGTKDGKPFTHGVCNRCNGLGRVANSPYEDHIILKSKLDEFQGSSMDPVGYVKVPVDATKMLEERAERMAKKGSSAINMDVEDEVGEVQSGVAKTIDRSAQSDTIYDIGSVVCDVHLNNEFYFINKYMNQVEDSSAQRDTDKNLPTINKPTRFNVESIAELVNNFKAGKESGLDRNFLQAKMTEILTRDLETNPQLKEYYASIINLDPLFGLGVDEIDSQLLKGTIRKVDVALHYNLKPFVDRAISDDKDFLTKPKEEQIDVLEGFAEELIKSEQPKLELSEPAGFSQGD